MFGYIYETTNLINGKKYIGQHRSLKFDNNYLGSGTYLRNAINKYGKENFKVRLIEECESMEDLNIKEKYYINKFKADLSKDYYNITAGGSNERTFRGKNNPMYGKHHLEETKNKIRNTFNIKLISKGENNSMYGKHHTFKSKSKISWKNSSSYKERCTNISLGTKLNMTSEIKEHLSKVRKDYLKDKNMIWINNSINEFWIDENCLNNYEGYILGRLPRVWINKNNKSKYVLKNKLNEFISDGYKLGRK